MPIVPVVKLGAVQMRHAGILSHLGIHFFQIANAKRLAGDVGMHGDGDDLRPLRALLVEPLGLATAAYSATSAFTSSM